MAGVRFDFNHFPQGVKGGVLTYPVSGVENGLRITSAGIKAATTDTIQVNITAGEARFDGFKVYLASDITGLELVPEGVNLTTDDYEAKIYLKPVRKVPALVDAPSTPAEGDMYAKVMDGSNYQMLEGVYRYNGTSWERYNVAHHVRNEAIEHGQMNLPLNHLAGNTISTATANNVNFGLTPEKDIYIQTVYPVYVSSQGAAFMRRDGSIHLGTVSFTGGVATITQASVIDEDMLTV